MASFLVNILKLRQQGLTTTKFWRKKMNRLTNLIVEGAITVEELANAPELIERAQFVKEALKACSQTLLFPLGKTELPCYSYTDRAGEYHSWGSVSQNGIFTCSCNWGGDHCIGRVNLTCPSDVFMAFENEDFAHDLRRFLEDQIKKISG